MIEGDLVARTDGRKDGQMNGWSSSSHSLKPIDRPLREKTSKKRTEEEEEHCLRISDPLGP